MTTLDPAQRSYRLRGKLAIWLGHLDRSERNGN